MSVLLSIAIFAVGFVLSRHWKKVGMEMLKQNKKDLYQHCLDKSTRWGILMIVGVIGLIVSLGGCS